MKTRRASNTELTLMATFITKCSENMILILIASKVSCLSGLEESHPLGDSDLLLLALPG